MVVDEKKHYVTARTFPKLLLLQPIVKKYILKLQCTDMKPLDLNVEEIIATQSPKEATLWGAPYPVYECGWESDEWFSRFLNKSSIGYRLVLFRDSRKRTIFKKTEKVFADELPFNLINQASIDDLNTRLNGVEVNHKRFRTNFLISGAQPYDEDNWKFIKIGENIFEIAKPCTSYRQETDPKLRRYAGTSPRMGVQMVLRSNNGGIVSINNDIYVAK